MKTWLVNTECNGYIGASVIQSVVGIWGLVLYRVLWVYGASVIQGVVGI